MILFYYSFITILGYIRSVDAVWTYMHVFLFPSELAMIPEIINCLLNDPKIAQKRNSVTQYLQNICLNKHFDLLRS